MSRRVDTRAAGSMASEAGSKAEGMASERSLADISQLEVQLRSLEPDGGCRS